MSTVFAVLAAGLFGVGTHLVLQRELTRMLIGLSLLSHGANVVLLAAAGPPGRPAFLDGRDDPSTFLDPIPQAFALTAIVITFGVTAFLLALAYRSWVLTRDDTVHDDPEDVRVRQDPTADIERSGVDHRQLGSIEGDEAP
ncbi:MAG: sodium:proton antiporter [Acidimicrobiia bacterium]